MGEKITFAITENYERIETKNKEIYSDFEYITTGKLTLENLYPPYQKGFQYRWNDTKKFSLEERLNDIVVGFIFASAWKKENEERRKIQEEKQKRLEAARREKVRLARIEKQRIVNFEKGTEHWIRYQNMASFVATVKGAYRKSRKKNNDISRWIRWATEYLLKYKAIIDNLVCYDVEEFDEYKERLKNFSPIFNPPPLEPYNFWERFW